MTCMFCHSESSVFWWPFTFGDNEGQICDGCVLALHDMILARRQTVGNGGRTE